MAKLKTVKDKIQASDIVKLLSERHMDDVFVPECTIGPRRLRMDAWTMKKSWVNAEYIGYEIKVNRSDFLHDDKWVGYLPFCSKFYFVCPWGLIDPSEVGEKAGLMYVTKTNSRMVIKKKAPVLSDDVASREMIMSAILMTRVEIVKSTFNGGGMIVESDKVYWERWLKDKQYWNALGKSVSKELRRRVNLKIDQVEEDNTKLIIENNKLKDVKDFVEAHGLSLNAYYPVQQLEKRFKKDLSSLKTKMNQGIHALQSITRKLDEELNEDDEKK